jgi:hypothetical protein
MDTWVRGSLGFQGMTNFTVNIYNQWIAWSQDCQ